MLPEEIAEHTEAIKNLGVFVSIPVVEKDGKYYLQAGKRRLIAAKKEGLKTVPIEIKSDEDA